MDVNYFSRCLHTFNTYFYHFILDQEPQTELVAQLAQEFYNSNIFFLLVKHLGKLDFEVA